MRRWPTALGVALAAFTLIAPPVGAQEDGEERAVDVSFDLGDFDAERGDWPITVVYVSGDLDEGAPFTVYLGDDESELWSATETFQGPITAVTVLPFVAVGDVTRTAVAQDLPVVLDDGIIIAPPTTDGPDVLEEAVVVETPAPNPNPPRIPNPAGPVTEVLGQGAGGGGGGVLALSMVLAVVLVAIVFRTPLPSQSTQRWTK